MVGETIEGSEGVETVGEGVEEAVAVEDHEKVITGGRKVTATINRRADEAGTGERMEMEGFLQTEEVVVVSKFL